MELIDSTSSFSASFSQSTAFFVGHGRPFVLYALNLSFEILRMETSQKSPVKTILEFFPAAPTKVIFFLQFKLQGNHKIIVSFWCERIGGGYPSLGFLQRLSRLFRVGKKNRTKAKRRTERFCCPEFIGINLVLRSLSVCI